MIWASEPGRWREGPKDDKISFEDVGDAGWQLRIVDDHGDGSVTNEVFNRDNIQYRLIRPLSACGIPL